MCHWRGAFGVGNPPGNAIGAPCHNCGLPPEGSTPKEKHPLCPSAPSPKATRQRIIKSFALGSCARSLAVRALCAHPRHSNASHKAIAPHKPRATALACERPIAKRPTFHRQSPPRRPHAKGIILDFPLDRAHAVLQCAPPCAHPRKSNASQKAIAPHKRRAGEMALERQSRSAPPFTSQWV